MARRTNFNESTNMNNRTYGAYLNRLIELSMSMFEWKNVPDTIDVRFLELKLFENGSIVFFEDKDLGYLALPVAFNGGFDVYQIPLRRRAYAYNGYQKELTNKDSVVIWNNYLHTNSSVDVKAFAKRLYNLDRIIDVNANAQKTPVLVQGSEQQRLTLLNVYKEYDGNSPVIYGDKNLDINCLKVLQTNAPYVADKIYELKSQIWNEALTYLGISNTNITKKERMISDEVIRNMGGVIASRHSRLESRRQACEKINEMFGLDMWCDYREDYRETDDEVMLSGKTGDNAFYNMVTDIRTRTNTDRGEEGE